MPLRGFLVPLSFPASASCPVSVFSASLSSLPLYSRWLLTLGSFIFTIQGIVEKKKIRKEPWVPPTVGFYYPRCCLYIERVLHGCPTHVAGYSDGRNVSNMYKFFYLFHQTDEKDSIKQVNQSKICLKFYFILQFGCIIRFRMLN